MLQGMAMGSETLATMILSTTRGYDLSCIWVGKCPFFRNCIFGVDAPLFDDIWREGKAHIRAIPSAGAMCLR